MPFAERHLSRRATIEAAGRRVKMYHLTVFAEAIEESIVTAAEAFLSRLVAPLDETPPAAFAILHRGSDGAYLNVYSWVWDNVLECHTAVAGVPFLGCPDADPTHFVSLDRPWIGCVWELGPFEHERAAWVRHMLVPDQPQLQAYLADGLADALTGGPGPGPVATRHGLGR
jgi:hypothetical protein